MTAALSGNGPTARDRWLVLLFVSLAMFGNYYAFDALNPVGPLLEAQLGFTQAQIGLLDTAYNVAALLVLLAGGILIDRAGTKRAMVAFGVITAVGAFVIAAAPSHLTMAAGRFIMGLGAEPLIVAATTVLGRWFKGRELGFAMGVNLMIARFGSVAADNSRGFAAGLFDSWQPPLLFAGFVACTCIAGGVLYAIVERRSERAIARDTSVVSDKLVLADLVRFDRSYWYVVGLCVTFYSAVFPFRRFANIVFEHAHGASPGQAAFLNGVIPLTAMFATPLFGLLVDKIGRRALLMTVGSLLLFPAFLIIAETRLPLGLAVTLLGLSFSLVPAILWPSVTYLVDERRLGTAYAMMTFCQQIGWGVMAWAVGRVNDLNAAGPANAGGYAPGLWMFAGLGFLGLLFSFLLWRSERGPEAHGLETIRV
ncbi:MAG TPA: MFS transporter [Vicinamibacterales bacterium]|nr:MFS transporter [Vicinamibacterales bacterium]